MPVCVAAVRGKTSQVWEPEGVPNTALHDEDGEAILDETGDYITEN